MNRRFSHRSPVSYQPAEILEPRRLLAAVSALAAPSDPVQPLAVQTYDTNALSRQVQVNLRAFSGTVKNGSNFYADLTADSGTASGLVYFYADNQPIGAGWIVDGTAWMHTRQLPAGTHNVYAVYVGDTLHDRAGSNPISHNVAPTPAPLAKAVFGRWDWRGNGATQVTGFYAPGAAVVPTGTLSFHNLPTEGESTWKVTAALDGDGRADFGVIDPPDDLTYLYYTYSGDANYDAESNLIYIPQPYTPANPTATAIELSANAPATNPGDSITFKAALQRPAAQSLAAAYAGKVRFWSGDVLLGAANVDPSGTAFLVVDANHPSNITREGLNKITAIYTGDSTHAPAETRIYHGVIPSAALTRTTLSADKSVARQDQTVTFTAAVTDVFGAAIPNQLGQVRLLDQYGKDLTAAVRPDANGQATFIIHRLPADTYGVYAAYQGTPGQLGYTPSASTALPLTITAGTNPNRPNITARLAAVTTARNPANLVITLAKPNSPIPTGQVAIYSDRDGGKFIGYANLNAQGAATVNWQPGDSKFYQKIRIVYLGDANYAPNDATIALTPSFQNVQANAATGLPVTTQLAFMADVNGDGVRDMVFRDTATGGVLIRTINNAGQVTGDKTLPAVPPATWSLDAGGDIDGDGDADLIWRNLASSRAYVWTLSNGGALQSQGYVNAGGTQTGWRIVGADDFDKDGKADIVWSNDVNGKRAVWLMNNRTVKGFTIFNHAPRDTAWIIQSIEDLDGDTNPDLLWFNTTTQNTFVWLMNGTAVKGTMAAS